MLSNRFCEMQGGTLDRAEVVTVAFTDPLNKIPLDTPPLKTIPLGIHPFKKVPLDVHPMEKIPLEKIPI